MIKIFITSFTQVFFVAINTIFLSKGNIVGIGIASFFISLIWCFNVAKISMSKTKHKLVYSLGAMIGALSGYYFTKLF
jgi:hypothetical protein